MGKNLKGKELGKGLSQRKNGRFSARFVSQTGVRKEKYFNTLPEARNWLEDARLKDSHSTILAPFEAVADDVLNNDTTLPAPSDMTVDDWFNFWIENIIPHLAWNTRRNYRDRYERNVKPLIGNMRIQDVRPMHIRKILNDMDKDYKGSTIRQTFICMGTVFKSALENSIIDKHPMNGVKYTKTVKSISDVKVLTIEEQEKFLKAAKQSHNYLQYALILETGLRTGEMIGLTWDAINFQDRTLTVNKTLEYRHSRGYWSAGPPKTVSSYRTIPLTERAYNILCELYKQKDTRKQSKGLSQKLEYMDRISGEMKTLVMSDLVFINYRLGMPAKNSSYDTHLYKLCDKAGIKRISMHTLRHTYATRAIERGVNPKALQRLLGHASLRVTMDTYVHVTDDSMNQAIRQFENGAPHNVEMA